MKAKMVRSWELLPVLFQRSGGSEKDDSMSASGHWMWQFVEGGPGELKFGAVT